MSRSPTTLNDLPNEILLNIAAHCTSVVARNGDLARLALVSRRWRGIAQEWLLKRPCFKLENIDRYIWELGHRPHLLRQVRTLEIWSESAGRVQYDPNGGAAKRKPEETSAPRPSIWCNDFIDMCVAIIMHFAPNSTNKKSWLNALRQNSKSALFCVLLCALPNLTGLKLGSAWLYDFPLFMLLQSPDILACYSHTDNWPHGFAISALQRIFPQLEVLEVPTDMTTVGFPVRAPSVFDLRRFQNLKEVGITQKALWWLPLRTRIPPDPREVFPPTLTILRISEATKNTAMTIEYLCLAKKGGHFPALRRVELYYMHNIEHNEKTAIPVLRPHLVQDIQGIFKDTELEVYMFFPGQELKTWEHLGTPWALNNEGVLKVAVRCVEMGGGLVYPRPNSVYAFPHFEVEWDRDGDAVMT